MTELEFDLVDADLAAFNLSALETSSAGQRQRRYYRIVLTVIVPVMVALFIGFAFKEPVDAVIVAAVTGVVLWFLSPRLWMREIRRNVNRMSKDGGLGRTGRHLLTLDDHGIHERSSHGSTDVNWDAVDRVAETAEHAFVYFSPVQAIVIPKRVGAERVQAILDEVRARATTET